MAKRKLEAHLRAVLDQRGRLLEAEGDELDGGTCIDLPWIYLKLDEQHEKKVNAGKASSAERRRQADVRVAANRERARKKIDAYRATGHGRRDVTAMLARYLKISLPEARAYRDEFWPKEK